MKEVGVNWALRKAGAACSSTTEITQVYFDISKSDLFYESQVKYTILILKAYDHYVESIRSFD